MPVYSGSVFLPGEALEQIAGGVSDFANRPSDPKMAMYIIVGDLIGSAARGEPVTLPIFLMVMMRMAKRMEGARRGLSGRWTSLGLST